MAEARTIGVCTGGGDCPGLNAVIRGVVKAAILRYGWRVIGVEDGFEGLLWPGKCRELALKDVSGILYRGGTILGTTNRGNPFSYKAEENGKTVVRDYSGRVIDNAREMGIEALVVIGGDGTQKIALELFRKGLLVVGVPKTIDNDLSATDQTFGFDTAVQTATEAIDKLHTTAESHHRIMILEVMGRDAGWIALHSGIAGGAHIILIPEIPFRLANLRHFIRDRERTGHKYTLVVVAEGVRQMDGKPLLQVAEERRCAVRSGTVSGILAECLASACKRETRVTVLGHIQRGGSPTSFDRVLSSRFGVGAVELVAAGQYGRMVCLRGDRIESTALEEAVGVMRAVTPDSELVRTARSLGVFFGDQ
jgi:phosphofructokinase-like protein